MTYAGEDGLRAGGHAYPCTRVKMDRAVRGPYQKGTGTAVSTSKSFSSCSVDFTSVLLVFTSASFSFA